MKEGYWPSVAPPYDRYVLLAHLLPEVNRAGMAVSPDRLIRLQRLLETLPPDLPAQVLGPWLSPLFATDPLQQERFAQVFKAAIQSLEAAAPKEEAGRPASAKTIDQPTLKTPEAERKAEKPPERSAAYTVDIEQCTEPPYVWRIAAEEVAPIAEGSEHSRTLARLRSREASDLRFLDWPTTLRATIAQAGMPALHYRARTRTVEYLLLVERFSADDHRALLFDHLYQNLRSQDVLIERYFHDGDPRHCYNERHPNGISLRELHYRHVHARLLYMGNGYRLLDPETGQPADWAKNALLGWNTRLLLTPLARQRWGLREFQLKSLFILLPAAWEALRYAAEYPQPDQALRYAELPDYVRAAAEWPQAPLEAPFVPDLSAQLPKPLLLWTAACAVWPALHFQLTLQLGRLLSDDTHQLLQYHHLSRLAALPWFANGFIPKDARRELLEYLDTEHPDTLRRCAAYLLQLLQQQPPNNPRSYAAAEHTLYIAMLQTFAAPQPDEAALSRLRTVLKRLRRPAQITDFVLPRRWEALLKEAGFTEDPVFPPDTPDELDIRSPKGDQLGRMVSVKGGTFTMGWITERDGEGFDNEKPAHEVTVKDFYIGKYPVTQAQWRAVMGSDPPELHNKGCDNCPVERVSWNDIKEFLTKLNILTGKRYRLPTEAEWEYAARGGNQSQGFLYSGSSTIDEVAWYSGNYKNGNTYGSKKTTRPVGTKNPNELGLYDMSGNVWEWCEDDWHSNYNGAPKDGSAWVDSPRGGPRVLRGGSWYLNARYCRVAYRFSFYPTGRSDSGGFRLAL